MRGLEEYKRKRDFKRTPEPMGEHERPSDEAAIGGRFVIHKHAARNLHYDLRLEQDGVYKSWAVPKGPSLEPGEKRLAVQVEDHPLDYGDFEGVIPKGQYGGGTVMIWDRGIWTLAPGKRKHKSSEDRLDFVLIGEKLKGVWTLTRSSGRRGKGKNDWLLIKHHDKTDSEQSELNDFSVASGRSMEQIAAASDRTWTTHGASTQGKSARLNITSPHQAPLPTAPKPLLATSSSTAPAGDEWLHEIKLDGYRILALLDHGQVTLLSRNGKNWTHRFPEIAETLEELSNDTLIMDGEVTALSGDGSTSFSDLQSALANEKTAKLVYHAFDLLYLNGFDLSELPLIERKAVLHSLLSVAGLENSKRLRYSDHIQGMGPQFFNEACKLGLEGVISKRADSTYRPGRNRNWLKVKCSNQEEFVIGGYSDPSGKRSGFGALLLGAWEGDKLIYVGRVGTGFNERTLATLHKRLRKKEISESPFADSPEAKDVHWVKPELIAQVSFSRWTADGILRHSTFLGLREDKDPKDVLLPERSHKRTHTDSRETDVTAKSPTKTLARNNDKVRLEGVKLSNPDRVLYPESGVTKLDLAEFYLDIESWILPQIAMRPLSLLRCPSGYQDECFFQKHPHQTVSKSVPRVAIPEKNKPTNYLYVKDIADVLALVQIGALELHVWGSRVDTLEQPDLMVFDLDPGPELPYTELIDIARQLRDRLEQLGLPSFPRLTGGKGLHLVVPIEPERSWDDVKLFSQAVARQHAQDDRDRVTANMAKKHRTSRVFVDYLRNGRGATAIASYSTRARAGATVAVPISWDELNPAMEPSRYTVNNLRRRLSALRNDPWADLDRARVFLSSGMFKSLNL